MKSETRWGLVENDDWCEPEEDAPENTFTSTFLPQESKLGKAIIHFEDYPREYKQINSSQSGKHTGIRLNGEEVEQSGDKLWLPLDVITTALAVALAVLACLVSQTIINYQ